MSHIQFTRGPAWQDKIRAYCILIDGKEAASIGEQSEVRVSVSPGRHTVQLKIDWCTSPSIDANVAPGGTPVIACGPNSTPFLALLYITLWRTKYIWIKQVPVNA